MARKYKAFIVALLLAVGLDQGTKIWARQTLKPRYPDVVTVVPGFFELRYSENPGAAFGIFRNMPGGRYLFYAVGVAAFFVVGSYLRRARPEHLRLGAELGLLAGGAAGNLIDRVVIGRVTDFVVWRAGSFEWPTFNVADAALVVGIIGLLFDLKPEPAAEAEKKRA